MIRHHCRALIQDSDSDLPRNSPPLTFLSLSREIRDEIYDLALVSTSPIIVWKGEWKSDYHYYPETEGMIPFSSRLSSVIHWQKEVDYEATSASLQPLAANLILCNKTVSHEAARVFYTKNTFCFVGQHNWNPIVSWLESIGPTNRSSLSSIEISAGRPDPAWQCQNGERVADSDGWTRGEIYPLHPYLQLCTTEGRPRCGRVQNINPAVERIFVLLGQNTSEQKLRVVMQLDGCVYPGARMLSYAHDPMPEVSWYGMDLPNIIEKSRSLHTQQVEVLWKGKECRKELEDQQAIMESIGWVVNVLPAAEDELHPNPEYHGCHPATDEWRIANLCYTPWMLERYLQDTTKLEALFTEIAINQAQLRNSESHGTLQQTIIVDDHNVTGDCGASCQLEIELDEHFQTCGGSMVDEKAI